MTSTPQRTAAGRPWDADSLEPDVIRAQVAALLADPETEPGDDDHLIELGLDSLHLMRLVNTWRKVGADVRFAQLIEDPRLSAWWPLLRPVGAAPSASVEPAPEHRSDAPFPLTDVQHAYWIGRGSEQTLGGIGCHAYLEIDGRHVDPGRLQDAWRRLVAHHSMLRARFGGQGEQWIAANPADATCRLDVNDLRDETDAVVRAKLSDIRALRAHRRLHVSTGEVAGLALSLLPEGRTRLHLDIDLLVADVQSLHIVLRDLAALYAHDRTPPAPPVWHFGRYLETRAHDNETSVEQARSYWHERLPTLPGAPGLPLQCAPETLGTPRFTRRQYRLAPALWQQLQCQAAQARVTPAMVLASAYAEVLAAWSDTPRFLLNVPLFDRHGDTAGLNDVVADFTNLLLLEVDCSDALAFGERARRLQAQCHADVAHSAWSGVRIQRELAQMTTGERSFAPVVFACNLGTPLLDEDTRRSLGDLGYMISQTPQVWLDHQVYETDDGLLLCWDAVEELFPSGVLDAMFAAYTAVLKRLAEDESAWRAPLPALQPAAQRDVRESVNATAGPIPAHTLHGPIFERAAERGDGPAVIEGETGQTLDYAGLTRHALQVAALLQAQGIQPGEAVAITLPRGLDQIVAVLGVLAAGACYVPIGTGQPIARQQRIHARAGIACVLTAGPWLESVGSTGTPALDIADADRQAPLEAPIAVRPDDPAYVIFTSGSTGEPKGVEITHRAAANTIDDINRRHAVGPADRVLAVSALDFDLSVYDLFGLLGAGGAMVLIDEAERRDAAAWLGYLQQHRVTLWNSVPVLLDMLLIAAQGQSLALRVALVSGDWVGLDLSRRLAAIAPEAQLVALGGATEAAIWSNSCPVPARIPAHWHTIPYGTPLTNQRYRVVDTQGRDCPDWVAGELWIGGVGLARGYRGDAERSAESFVMHDGARWYRTGDIGRYWPDGTLEFLGRRDHQIKLRGHRIELGEIEAAILDQPGVQQAVAMVIEAPPTLAAAVVADAAVDIDAVAAAVAGLLPEYMLPTHWQPLEAVPLTRNGKIDRVAVAEQLVDSLVPTAFDAPVGDLECTIAAVWAEVLACQRVSRHDNFFQLGGDSLGATRLVEQLRRRGLADARVSLRSVFTAPTVVEQADMLQADASEGGMDTISEAFEEGAL